MIEAPTTSHSSSAAAFLGAHMAKHQVTVGAQLASGLCAATAVEMALRLAGNVGSMLSGDSSEENSYEFSANLGGTLFYGLAAANIIPGSAAGALIIHSIYSVSVYCLYKPEQNYLSSRVIGGAITELARNVVWPIVKTISNVVGKVFSWIGDTLGLIIPKSPIWLGVVILSLFTATYSLAPHMNLSKLPKLHVSLSFA